MTVATVETGEKFTTTRGPDHVPFVLDVVESCGSNNGLWYCVTHDVSFPNQLAKDSHIERGDHKLAWLCYEHGPETP